MSAAPVDQLLSPNDPSWPLAVLEMTQDVELDDAAVQPSTADKASPLTDEALIQIATEDSDYRVRREAAYALYQRGLRAGVEMANAAMDRQLARVKP